MVWIPASARAAELRTALVIGNGDYASLSGLTNPTNDAEDIAAALESLDFQVFVGTDLRRSEMDALIARFSEASQEADVALFYYAGHGFQIGAQNFIVPTDARLERREDVATQVISLDDTIAGLERNGGISLVFLDACRDNPLGANLSEQDGLARVGSAADFLFAFATQPDNVAYDGAGRNSFFTDAVLSHIHTPGQDIAELMIAVRRDVLANTGGRQIPWESTSLTRQFRFHPGEVTVSPETMLWQVAARANDPELMQLYLERFPTGAHVGDVRAFLDSDVAANALGMQDQAVRRLPSAGDRDADADRLWALAQRTRMRPLVEIYLEQHPDGTHAADARRLLATLPPVGRDAPNTICERLATHERDATGSRPGVPFLVLQQQASAAVEACRAAVQAFPDLPHYKALLARATAAAGQRDEALALYREAADAGDLRAMVSLGVIYEQGDGLARDPAAALALYERAAEGGSADAAINLAVALLEGTTVERDQTRGVDLLVRASEWGSPIATYNLGVLVQQGVADTGMTALELFAKASREGEPRGYLAAGVTLDDGRGGATRDPVAAADMLLRGAAADNGAIVTLLTGGAISRDTVREVQGRLRDAGLYEGTIDGLSGPQMQQALQDWRNGGFIGSLTP